MFSKSGLAPNCIVMLAVESTGAYLPAELTRRARFYSINRAFYHFDGRRKYSWAHERRSLFDGGSDHLEYAFFSRLGK
jgi:hypothetical protein